MILVCRFKINLMKKQLRLVGIVLAALAVCFVLLGLWINTIRPYIARLGEKNCPDFMFMVMNGSSHEPDVAAISGKIDPLALGSVVATTVGTSTVLISVRRVPASGQNFSEQDHQKILQALQSFRLQETVMETAGGGYAKTCISDDDFLRKNGYK